MVICSAGTDDGGTLLVLGLSHGNVERLREGQPIRVSRASHGMVVPEHLTICIFVGESEAAIEADLRNGGLIGPETVIGQQRPV